MAIGWHVVRVQQASGAHTESIYKGRWCENTSNSQVNRNLSVASVCVEACSVELIGSLLANWQLIGRVGKPFPKPLGRSETGENQGVVPTVKALRTWRSHAPVQVDRGRSERNEIGMAQLVGCEAFKRLTSRIPSSETRCRVVNERRRAHGSRANAAQSRSGHTEHRSAIVLYGETRN